MGNIPLVAVLIAIILAGILSARMYIAASVEKGKNSVHARCKVGNHLGPVVALRACSKTFDTPEGEIQILRNVHFDIHRGSIIALQGESGCGKSTLLNIIGGLDTPDNGTRMAFAGRLIDFCERNALVSLRQQVGFIYQSHNLVPHLSALDNVALALAAKGWSWREARGRAERWLTEVGLADRLNYKPHQLSGGQQQRVGLARALAGSPRILLADEPTGNLDRESAKTVMGLLHNCAGKMGMPILIATHDRNLAIKYCDRVLQWHERDGIFREDQIPQTTDVSQRQTVAVS